MKPIELPPKIFITGTDTDVGKTVVSAILVAGTKGAYWKPIQSGLTEETDTQCIRRITGLPEEHFFAETYRLSQPLSPHAAAAIDGKRIDLDAFELPDSSPHSHLIVEGAGGIMVPLNEEALMIDLMANLDLPVLVVASSRLGTINHTLLTLDKLAARKVVIAGVVMNGPPSESSERAIEHYGRTCVVARIDTLPSINRSALEKAFDDNFIVKKDKILTQP